MKYKLNLNKSIVITLIAIVLFLTTYEFILYKRHKGNFYFFAEYTGGRNKDCFDLLLKINGKKVFERDWMGYCNPNISPEIDTMLFLPIGLNTIEVSSQKLDIYYKEDIVNLLYMYGYFEINDQNDDYPVDSLKIINVRYGYGKLWLM